jgi:hypothetical protein
VKEKAGIYHNKTNLPIKEMAPHTAQMIRHNPTDPDSFSTTRGDTKIPEPSNIKVFEAVCRQNDLYILQL